MRLSQMTSLKMYNDRQAANKKTQSKDKTDSKSSETSKVKLNPQLQRLSNYALFLDSSTETGVGGLFGSKRYDFVSDVSDRIGSVNDFFVGKWLQNSQNGVYTKLKEAGYLVNQESSIDEKV